MVTSNSSSRLQKGRGAVENIVSRFDSVESQAFDDGWGGLDLPLEPLKTTVGEDKAKSIITRNKSPDIPFEQSINPYRGCEHGCIYCYARPSHAYLDLSPGLDFESKLFKKSDAASLLEQELRKPGYVCKPITLGANTDPYQPIERQYQITRQILEVLYAYRNPAAIITKSALIMRDLPLLGKMAQRRLIRVFVSVTTLDPILARTMEPRAAAPHRRLEAVKALAEAGVPTGIMAAPMIPALNDAELEAILSEGSKAGAVSAGYILVRLPDEVLPLFKQWLQTHYPNRYEHVMSLLRQCRGGQENDPRFNKRMKGEGPYATLLSQRFHLICRRLELNKNVWHLNTENFKPPPREGDQLNLF